MTTEPQALATVDDLQNRLPFEMDEDEKREAAGALEDLSDDARHYGKVQWSTAQRAPRQIVNLVLRAAGRHMKNYDGYTKSKAGDEDLGWTDRGEDAGSAYFTVREIKVLRQMSGSNGGGFHSVQATAWGSTSEGAGRRIPTDRGLDLPLYIPGEEP